MTVAKKFRYTLIQFALMTAIMMGNMKTCQASFNSFYCQLQKLRSVGGGGGSSINKENIYWIKTFSIEQKFKISSFFPVSNDFQVQWMKINNWKTASNKKSVARKSHVSITFFYIFTNADNFLSSLPAFPPTKASRHRMQSSARSPFPTYFPF